MGLAAAESGISMPRVHVVTLAKQSRIGLEISRGSVMGQTYGNNLHTIVTAPSSDGTEELATKWAEQGAVRHFIGAPPGIYAAMNWTLAKLPRNDYAIFLNAGDYFLHPCALSQLMAAAVRNTPAWSTSAFAVVGPNGWVRKVVGGESVGHLSDFGHQATVAPIGLLLELGGFDTSYRVFADGKVLRRLRSLGEPGWLAEPSVGYHLGGFSTKHPFLVHRELSRLNKEYDQLPLSTLDSLGLRLKSAGLAVAMKMQETKTFPAYFFRRRGARRQAIAGRLLASPHWDHERQDFDSLACCVRHLPRATDSDGGSAETVGSF